jgi:hypothetical protein
MLELAQVAIIVISLLIIGAVMYLSSRWF